MSVQKLNMTKTNSYEGNVIDGGLIWGDGPEGISAALLDTAAYGRGCSIGSTVQIPISMVCLPQ